MKNEGTSKKYSFDVIKELLNEAESFPYLKGHPVNEPNSMYFEEFFDVGKVKAYNVMGRPTVAIYLDTPISFDVVYTKIFSEVKKYPRITKIEFDLMKQRSSAWEYDLEALDLSEGRAFIRSVAGASLFDECWRETPEYNSLLAKKIGEQD